MKKVIWFCCFVVFLIGSVFAIVFGVQVGSLRNQMDDMKTKEEYLDYGESKYNEGLYDNDGYKPLLDTYVQQIAEMQESLTEMTGQLEELRQENSTSEETITQLEAVVESLESEIQRLENLMSAYEEIINQTHEVRFYVDDACVFNYAVKDGECFDKNKLTSELYESIKIEHRADVQSWVVDGVNINFALTPIVSDLRVDAVYKEVYKIEFDLLTEKRVIYTSGTEEVREINSEYCLKNPLQKDGMYMKGWSKNGTFASLSELLTIREDCLIEPVFVSATRLDSAVFGYYEDIVDGSKPGAIRIEYDSSYVAGFTAFDTNCVVSDIDNLIVRVELLNNTTNEKSYYEIKNGSWFKKYSQQFTFNFVLTNNGTLEIQVVPGEYVEGSDYTIMFNYLYELT